MEDFLRTSALSPSTRALLRRFCSLWQMTGHVSVPLKKFLPIVFLVVLCRVERWGLDLCIISSGDTDSHLCMWMCTCFLEKRFLSLWRGGPAPRRLLRPSIIPVECFLSFFWKKF